GLPLLPPLPHPPEPFRQEEPECPRRAGGGDPPHAPGGPPLDGGTFRGAGPSSLPGVPAAPPRLRAAGGHGRDLGLGLPATAAPPADHPPARPAAPGGHRPWMRGSAWHRPNSIRSGSSRG